MVGQEHEREDQGHRAGFEQREHEQHRAPGIGRERLAQYHDGAAKTYDLPGDEETHRVLHAKNAERADETGGGPKEPTCLALDRRAEPASEYRAGKPEAHEPQRFGRQPEHRAGGPNPEHGMDGRQIAGQEFGRESNQCDAANAEKGARDRSAYIRECEQRCDDPCGKTGDEQLDH